MANMNTLFRKGYLLAGVIMAANMFAVNEVKATEENNKEKENITPNDNENLIPVEESNELYYFNKKYENASFLIKGVLYRVLSSENYINLIGGVISSVANNYLKWWDYNPGKYSKLGCLGWRSGRLIKDIFQFDINLNLGRGGFWLIPGIFGFIQYRKKKERPIILNSTAGLITLKILYTNEEDFKNNNSGFGFVVSYFIFFILQGFVSMHLTLHISNFSIAISLDSIIWMGIGKFLDKGKEEDIKIDLDNKNDDSE